MSEDQALQEEVVRIDRAYVELQSNKYYMYVLGLAGLLAGLMAVKSLFTLVGVYETVSDSTTVEFLELALIVLLFGEIGFVARMAQLDSLQNITHKPLGVDCLLAFVSLICYLLDNLVKIRVVNGILEILWTLPYTVRAVFAVMKSAAAVKDEVAKQPSSKFTVMPSVSKSAMASAVLGRLAKF
jgi:hypothetical protein